MIDFSRIRTIAQALAMHNRIHAEYASAQGLTNRRRAQLQGDHEQIVRRLTALGGRHLPRAESLDQSLPPEMQNEVRFSCITEFPALADDKPAVSSIQVLRTGIFHHPAYGKFEISQDMLKTIMRNFEEHHPKPPTEMVVDFEHQSARAGEKALAAGWVKSLQLQDSALFAKIEWTEDAAKQIRSKEYRFISPQIDMNYRDKDTGKAIGATLLSIALTNRPFIEGMQPVVLSERFDGSDFEVILSEVWGEIGLAESAEVEGVDTSISGVVSYEEINKHGEAEMEKELREILSLTEDGDIAGAIRKGQTDLAGAKKELGEALLKLTDVEKKVLVFEAGKLVDKAIEEGKLLPAMASEAREMALNDPAAFEKSLAWAGKIAPSLKILGSDAAEGDIVLTDVERRIAGQLEVDEADLKKYK